MCVAIDIIRKAIDLTPRTDLPKANSTNLTTATTSRSEVSCNKKVF